MITNPHRQKIKAINSVNYLFDDTDDKKNRKSPNSIRILKSVYEYASMGIGIRNAATRLALSKVQHRLPQWAIIKEGKIEKSAEFHADRKHKMESVLKFQFQIN